MVLHARRQLGGLQREVLLRLWRTLPGALLPTVAFLGVENPEPTGLKVRGFLGHGDLTVQCAVLHVNCPACNQRILEDGQDSDVLGSFRECILPKPTANVYGHGEELVISAAEQNQRVCLSMGTPTPSVYLIHPTFFMQMSVHHHRDSRIEVVVPPPPPAPEDVHVHVPSISSSDASLPRVPPTQPPPPPPPVLRPPDQSTYTAGDSEARMPPPAPLSRPLPPPAPYPEVAEQPGMVSMMDLLELARVPMNQPQTPSTRCTLPISFVQDV
eukprot:s5616_g5.t2